MCIFLALAVTRLTCFSECNKTRIPDEVCCEPSAATRVHLTPHSLFHSFQYVFFKCKVSEHVVYDIYLFIYDGHSKAWSRTIANCIYNTQIQSEENMYLRKQATGAVIISLSCMLPFYCHKIYLKVYCVTFRLCCLSTNAPKDQRRNFEVRKQRMDMNENLNFLNWMFSL